MRRLSEYKHRLEARFAHSPSPQILAFSNSFRPANCDTQHASIGHLGELTLNRGESK